MGRPAISERLPEATTTHTYQTEGQYVVIARLEEPDVGETKSTILVDVKRGTKDEIDPRLITWLSPATTNVSDWAVTSEIIDITINGSVVCIYHTKAGQWPLVSIDENPPNIEGNIAIVANVNGQWFGGGFDWLGEGRVCKDVDPSEYGRDQIRVWPLDASWPGPQSGEMVGLLITTPSSDRIRVRSVNERTNIKLVRWP